MAKKYQVVNMKPQITGDVTNFIAGIQGVAAGSQVLIQLPCDRRYKKLLFQCKAVNYTGGTAKTMPKITGSGVGLTGTATIVNGVVTAVAVVAAGSGFVTGDTVSLTDDTGTGFIGTVTASAGAVTAVAVTNGGTPSAINPATMITSMMITPAGKNVRDVAPNDYLRIAAFNLCPATLGNLPIYFAEPWRQANKQQDYTAWDMFGQPSFTITLNLSPSVVSPQLVGTMTFDYKRILEDGKPIVSPVAYHNYSINVPSGLNQINTLPFTYPISRMHLSGSTAAQISQIEVDADTVDVFEGLTAQIAEDQRNTGNFNPAQFDLSIVPDLHNELGHQLIASKSLVVKPTSAIGQSITFLMLTLPGNYI